MENLPPEAATLDGFAAAVEEMTRAFNIIARFDSRVMAQVWNERVQRGDWEFGPVEEANWPQVVVTAQRIKIWIEKNPDLIRLAKDMRTISLDHAPGKMPAGLQ